MNQLLQWETLIFLAPLIVGVLMVLISFSSSVGDHGADIHADVGIDHASELHLGGHDAFDADHSAEVGGHLHFSLAEFFGIGRAPLGILIMSASFLWAITGLIGNALLGQSMIAVTLAVAAVMVFVGTGFMGRTIGKFIKPVESYSTRGLEDLWGEQAEVRFNVTKESGTIRVVDRHGNLLDLRARLAATADLDEPIKPGERVTIEDYDEGSQSFIVSRN